LIKPLQVHAQIIRIDIPIMIGVSLLTTLLLLDGDLSRLDGFILGIGIVAYTWFSIQLARKEKNQSVHQEFDSHLPSPLRAAWLDPLLLGAGLATLVLGGNLLVSGAVTLALLAGLSNAFVGLTIVAIGTSLPELATSVVAAARGEGDIAIGNVVGSNIFNLLLILGLSSLIRPIRADGIHASDLIVMIALALFILPVMRSGLAISRREGGVLLVMYIGYMFYLISRGA
jgi:cation:H+ antiporter